MSMTRKFKDAIGDDDAIKRVVKERTEARMARVDAMPRDVRECVHAYGFHVVDTLLSVGVTKPKHIRHVVETILNEFSPTRASASSQGQKSDYFNPVTPTHS